MQVFVRFYFFFRLKTLLNSEPQTIICGCKGTTKIAYTQIFFIKYWFGIIFA